jgi:hypothetical protein
MILMMKMMDGARNRIIRRVLRIITIIKSHLTKSTVMLPTLKTSQIHFPKK